MFRLLVLVASLSLAGGFSQYQTRVPNGARVPNPCRTGETWPGVGHKLTAGSGERNPFGLAFANNSFVWDVKLCNQDSDGDGKSNGLELGDPNCTWTEGSGAPKLSTGLSHPGICEPLSSSLCKEKNSWLQCVNNFSCPAFDLPTTKNLSFVFPRTAVPELQTTYICFAFQLPSDKQYHAIGFKPVVGNPNVLHHMLLYGCKVAPKAEYLAEPTVCGMGMPECPSMIGLWTPGNIGQCNADAYGFPIGLTGFKYALLQLHWTNAPTPMPNLFDASGMILYYTDKLRPNDGMLLQTGQVDLLIPPNKDAVTVEGSCKKECSKSMKPAVIHIAAATLHMHLLGHAGSVVLVRDGQVIETLVEEPIYDYNSPKLISFDKPIEYRAGDEIKVTCVFSSLGRNKTTVYGDGTLDEMCYGFVTVYPAVPGFDFCVEYKSQPLCTKPLFNTSARCDQPTLTALIPLAGARCNASCSPVCQGLVAAMRSTGCLDGENKEIVTVNWPMRFPEMRPLFSVVDQCSMPCDGATGKPAEKPTEKPTEKPRVVNELVGGASVIQGGISCYVGMIVMMLFGGREFLY